MRLSVEQVSERDTVVQVHPPALMRRPILDCLYCGKPFYPVNGREKLQKYCKPSHRKNAFRRKKCHFVGQ